MFLGSDNIPVPIFNISCLLHQVVPTMVSGVKSKKALENLSPQPYFKLFTMGSSLKTVIYRCFSVITGRSQKSKKILFG